MQRVLFLFLVLFNIGLVRLSDLEPEPKDKSTISDDYDVIDKEEIDFDYETFDFEIPVSGRHASLEPTTAVPPQGSLDQYTVLNSNTDLSGRLGLKNHANICYMNSIISPLFNIKGFRNALYGATHTNTTSVLLALVFAKLQISSKTVRTDLCLMQAIQKELDWAFIKFQCVLEFAGLVLHRLPIQATFKMENRYTNLMKSNGQVLKAKVIEDNIYMIPKGFASVSEAISLNFVDREAEDYKIVLADYHEYEGIIPPFTEASISIPIYNEVTILNRPEMIFLGIHRLQFTPVVSFDSTHVIANFEFELPGLGAGSAPVKYLLNGFSFFKNPGHYMSYIRDFSRGNPEGDWYLYNDSSVMAVRTVQQYELMKKNADTAACLLFYSRQDTIDYGAVEDAPIPEGIINIAKLFLALEGVDDVKLDLEAAQRERKKKYQRSPVYVPAEHSFQGTNSGSNTAAAAEIADMLHPTQFRSFPTMNDDEINRTVLLPPRTSVEFGVNFPLDFNYYESEIDLS